MHKFIFKKKKKKEPMQFEKISTAWEEEGEGGAARSKDDSQDSCLRNRVKGQVLQEFEKPKGRTKFGEDIHKVWKEIEETVSFSSTMALF